MQNNKKQGMTLVELLMAMAIFTLGIAGFMLLGIKSWKINASVLEAGTATGKATRALNATVKSLREIRQADNGSYPVKEVGSNSLTVYLNDDNDDAIERVHYYYEASTQTFKKGITQPSTSPVSYPNGDQETKIVANYVVNTSSQPVFEYYDKNYPIDTVNNPMASPVPAEVKLVKVRLWINIKPLTAPDNVNLESFAEFRNLNENN